MLAKPQPPRIPLPKNWPGCVKSAVIHTIALAHYSIVYARAWAADSINARVRLAAEKDRFYEECALLREELRIKDARSLRTPPQRRPHYNPQERVAVLELRAARGWSLKQTADSFLITSATIASWMKRIDEQGPDALLQLREPVNKLPDFVRYIVQRLKTLNPTMGKIKIAETLCRAGLHLGVTTVGRIIKEYRQAAQPCLACRSHRCSHIGRLLGTVAAVRTTPVLAVLLVGGGGHRPLLATRDVHGSIQEQSHIRIGFALPRMRHSQRQCHTKTHHLRQGPAVLVRCVQTLV